LFKFMEQEADYYKDVRELSVDVVDETGGGEAK
jgi:hypothetical protein